jgi:C-terminal processing protease CtpA/Prc
MKPVPSIRFASLCMIAFASSVASLCAADEPAPQKGPPPAVLDATLLQIRSQVDQSYVDPTRIGFSNWTLRYAGKLDNSGNLRVAVDAMLASNDDSRLRLLDDKQAKAYKCRLQSAIVGIGAVFNIKVTLLKGFEVSTVLDNSPAQRANLPSGTTIVAIDGTRLAGTDLVDSLSLLLTDKPEIVLTVLGSDDKETAYKITRKDSGERFGIGFNTGKTTMKVTVEEVLSGAPAERAGLKAGDEVTHVYSNTVSNGDSDWFVNNQVAGELGEAVSLKVRRGDAQLDFSVTREFVEREELAYSLTMEGQPRTTQMRVSNLDWVKIPELVGRHVKTINLLKECTVDLRGASGDNPELAARVAARLIYRLPGEILCFSETRFGKTQTTSYNIDERDGKRVLVCSAGSLKTVVEEIEDVVSCKVTVLVDSQTSGTAEALALALQRGGATITGTETANRSVLVSTETFKVGDTELLVQVPTKRLVPGQNYKSLVIAPDNFTGSKNGRGWSWAALIGGVVALLFAALAASRSSRKKMSLAAQNLEQGAAFRTKLQRVGPPLMVASLGLVGSLLIYTGCTGSFVSAKTDSQKASAHVANILRTDEEARLNRLKSANVPRGKLDVEPKFADGEPKVTDGEIASACQIVEAIAEGDIEAVRRIVASYAHKPYARAQIASALNHSFYKAGVPLRVEFYGGSFVIEREGLADGQAAVSFSPINEEPTVRVMVRNPKYPRQFTSTENSEMFNAREVFATFKGPLIRSVLEQSLTKKD